jgi:hypothetical protein
LRVLFRGVELDLERTVREAGLTPLERFDVRRSES